MIVAPTEPPSLRALATQVALLPEEYGVDVLFTAKGKMIGVQRKEFGDLLASLKDGRLAKECSQMQPLHIASIIIEGEPRWTNDGQLIDRYARFTRAQYRGLLHSLRSKGIWVIETSGLDETILEILDLNVWCQKDEHMSLARRPAAQGEWGKPTSRDFLLWVLQGFPGIGPGLAARILDRFGGKLPLRWTCTQQDLKGIEGLGPKKLVGLWEGLDHDG